MTTTTTVQRAPELDQRTNPLRRIVSQEPALVLGIITALVDLAAYGAKRWAGLDVPTGAIVAWCVATLGLQVAGTRAAVWAPDSVATATAAARAEGGEVVARALAASDVPAAVATLSGTTARRLRFDNGEPVIAPPPGQRTS